MRVFRTTGDLNDFLKEVQSTLGNPDFVPTMGALHQGHAALIRRAKENNPFVVVSIFVNPTQFNNVQDLEKYPRTEEKDLELLKQLDVTAVFIPSPEEIYPDSFEEIDLDLGFLDTTMEGASRPGHFKGVVNVVKRLFDIVEPNTAYFGQKDFQQVAVIKYMVNQLKLKTKLVIVPTTREESGLAMSSRNLRLSDDQKIEALHIYRILVEAKHKTPHTLPDELEQWIVAEFNKTKLQVDYCKIVHPDSLKDLSNQWVAGATCCVAVYCGEVRLIDNLELIPAN